MCSAIDGSNSAIMTQPNFCNDKARCRIAVKPGGEMTEKSFLERVSGGLGTTVTTTLIAASGGGYLAPLLPALTGALANQRYQKRVEEALQEVNQRIAENEKVINSITDNQLKLVSEIVSAIMHTTNAEKIEVLKRSAINGVTADDIDDHEVSIISRVLRDISILEFEFLLRLEEIQAVIVASTDERPKSKNPDQLWIDAHEQDAELLIGLVNLGLVSPTGSGWGGTLNYRVLGVAHKLMSLARL